MFPHGATPSVLICGDYEYLLFETCAGDLVWVQHTGVKDRHGKEIYEGDVVRYMDYDAIDFFDTKPSLVETEKIQVVEWCEGCYFDPLLNTLRGVDNVHTSDLVFEIIGKIYENPELEERLT